MKSTIEKLRSGNISDLLSMAQSIRNRVTFFEIKLPGYIYINLFRSGKWMVSDDRYSVTGHTESLVEAFKNIEEEVVV